MKCTLGDLMDVTSVKRIHQSDWRNSGVPFYRARDIVAFAKNEIISDPLFIDLARYEEYSIQSGKVESGNLLVTGVGTIGIPYLVKGTSPLYFKDGNIIWFKNKKLDGKYLYYSFTANSIQQFIHYSAGTGTVSTYTIDTGKKTPIFEPVIDEQYKIGTFFDKLDDLITVNERELNKLKDLKKSYLEKMFPKNGSDIPELRFPGYADAWVKCKLGDVGKTFTGLSGKTKEDFGHGEGKFVTYINVFKNPISDLNELENVEIDDNQAQVNYGDVLFTTSSETPDEVGMSSVWLGKQDNIYLNSFCFGYRPQLVFDYIYLAFMLRSPSIRNHFMLLAQGISRYNISKNKAMEISVPIPELNEQTKIGEFFKHLDDLITVNERELNKLKELKKSYLKDMFV